MMFFILSTNHIKKNQNQEWIDPQYVVVLVIL